jgi:hypothetical protein
MRCFIVGSFVMSQGQYDTKETEERLQRTLQGAFAGPPTPLKAIPKKNGESRGTKPKKRRSKKS